VPAKKNEACSIIFSCFVFNGYNLLTAKTHLMLFYLIFTTNDRYSKKISWRRVKFNVSRSYLQKIL